MLGIYVPSYITIQYKERDANVAIVKIHLNGKGNRSSIIVTHNEGG